MRHLEPDPVREFLDGFREWQLIVLHEETERGAVRAAAEAVIELLVRAHPERGGLFVVERAAGLELAPGLFQRHAAADEFDDVGTGDKLVDEGLGNAAGHGFKSTREFVRPKPAWCGIHGRRLIAACGRAAGPCCSTVRSSRLPPAACRLPPAACRLRPRSARRKSPLP